MNKRRPLIALGAAVTGALALLTPHLTHAQSWIGGYVSDGLFAIVQWVAYGVSYIISAIAVIVFAIEVFALNLAIDLNFTIVNNPGVQISFSVILAFANILFVAAVIIMAVATIVRYDAYGYKQLLWKIVIAAIGVNFSLILAGTVINFSDSLTKFFLNNAVPVNNAEPFAENKPNIRSFTNTLAGAFNPQRLYSISPDLDTNKSIITKAGNDLGKVTAAIAGIYMTAGMAVVMAIFMGVLAGAFFMRFIMLALLLTIMPAVWVAWLVPFGRPLVNWWRDKFVKWTFFAPMTMFFLYLSMKTLEVYNGMHIFDQASISGEFQSGGKALGDGLVGTMGPLARPLVENIIKFTLVAGTLWGGLLLASRMGIKAAGAGVKAMESVGNSVKRRASTFAKDRSLAAYDKIRTGKKDEFGNSWLQRQGSRISQTKLASSNAFGYKTLRKAIFATTGVTPDAIGTTIANVGMPNKKDEEERAKRYKESNAAKTGPAIRTEFERNLTGTLRLNPAQERGNVMNMIEKKQMGELHKYVLNEDGTVNTVKETQLKKFMQRATDAGYAEDILKANPLMARFAPPKMVDRRNKKGEIIKEKDAKGNTIKRAVTQAEAVHGAIKGAKAEDISDLVSKNLDVFGPADNSAPTFEQIKAVQALGGRVSKLDDPDAIARVHKTMTWVFQQKKKRDDALAADRAAKLAAHKAAGRDEKDFAYDEKDFAYVEANTPDTLNADKTYTKLFADINESLTKDRFSTGGLAFRDADFDQFNPAIRQLEKNTAIAPILQEIIDNGGKKKKKKNNNSGNTTGTGGSTGNQQATDEEDEDDDDGDDDDGGGNTPPNPNTPPPNPKQQKTNKNRNKRRQRTNNNRKNKGKAPKPPKKPNDRPRPNTITIK